MQNVPTRIGPYRLGRLLGKGALSQVYLAVDERNGQNYALKLTPIPSEGEDRVSRRALCRNEAFVLFTARHPGIVTPRDFIEEEAFSALTMSLAGKVTLEQVLKQQGKIPLPFVLEIGIRICTALQHLHTLCDEAGNPLGITHNDLKPGNLLLGRSGHVFLIDFGVVTFPWSFHELSENQTMGTPLYTSPEQALGRITELDARSDLFALGGVLVELTLNKHPFHGYPTSFDTMKGIVADTYQALAFTSNHLKDAGCGRMIPIIRGLLQKDPRDRFPSARQLELALRACKKELVGSTKKHQALFTRFYRRWCKRVTRTPSHKPTSCLA